MTVQLSIGSSPNDLSPKTNVIERAVDLHALRVIGSSGYQRCVTYLWRGWLVQNDDNPVHFIYYKDRANPNYWVHFDPDRMRVPLYQNIVQVLISIVYLALYTGVINTVNSTGDLDIVEDGVLKGDEKLRGLERLEQRLLLWLARNTTWNKRAD